jgi:hypothetical protein
MEDVSGWLHDRAFEEDVDLHVFRERLGWSPSAAQLGCALSHREAYRQLLRSRAKWAVVLEDDVSAAIPCGFLGQLMDRLSDLPVIVQLFSRGQSHVEPFRVWDLACQHDIFEFRYVPQQTAAYAISAPAAQLAVDHRIDGPADWPSFASQVAFLGIYPWPFAESGDNSRIPVEPPTDYRRFGQWTMLLALALRASHRGQLTDFSYRSFLPRLESFLWRLAGRPRFEGQPDGPWRSLLPPVFINVSRRKSQAVRRQVRTRLKAGVCTSEVPEPLC